MKNAQPFFTALKERSPSPLPRPLSDLLEQREVQPVPQWLVQDEAVAPPMEPPPEPAPVVEATPPPAPAPDPAMLQRLSAGIESLVEAQRAVAETPDVVALAMTVARAILEREILIDPAGLSTAIEEALDTLREETAIKVRVAPGLFEWFVDEKPNLLNDEIEIILDPALEAGGCIVESEMHVLDVSLSSRLQRFEEAMREALAIADEGSMP